MKLRVGDLVEVMTGKDRGKRGKIEHLFLKESSVAVEKVNRFKKHLKPTRRYPQGGIVEVSRPLPASNVMVVCPHCSKLTRVGITIAGDKKMRTCKKCGKALEEGKRK